MKLSLILFLSVNKCISYSNLGDFYFGYDEGIDYPCLQSEILCEKVPKISTYAGKELFKN